jgi:uncharacterized protein YgiB involved in biofilm formation
MEDRNRSSGHDAIYESHDVSTDSVAASLRPKRSKRSAHLTLIFIAATAGLAGCGRLENDGDVSRDVYANIEECRADWGNPDDCEEIDEKRSATGTRSYYGPRYSSRTGSYNSSGYSTITRPGSRSKGTVSSSPSRGGFGASSSRHGGSSHSSSG